jgi:predicted MFS family arabinose efflux permease
MKAAHPLHGGGTARELPLPSFSFSWALSYLLALAAGLTVANIYYNQPLLPAIGKDFQTTAAAMGALAVATQLGYAFGLLLLVPLGDTVERRPLILASAFGSSLVLLVVIVSPNLPCLIGASFLLGLISITPQLIVPYAAALAAPQNRGHIVGLIMGGLFMGILFSRVAGGFIGNEFGWKAVFGLGSGLTILLTLVLFLYLPRQPPASRLTYFQLLGSLFPLLAREPVLRRHAFMGALGFGAFSAFWTTLAFYLESRPEHFGGQTVGWFGLVAMGGSAVASLSGWLSDRWSAQVVNGSSLLIVMAAFLLMALAGLSIGWLIAGVFLMDAGVQTNQISNQTRIYALAPELRNRITSVYMFCYFMGGAVGSALGSGAWARWHWTGVCLTGAALAALAAMPLLSRGSPRRLAPEMLNRFKQ